MTSTYASTNVIDDRVRLAALAEQQTTGRKRYDKAA